jgi:two-component system, OmpR family, alkaline phosphatase synthesis response regulator PhoP
MFMIQPPRILVIDDEQAIRMVIEACLVDLGGWEVLEADSGVTGLELAATESIDGILLDISMPEMDGIATLEQLKKNPQTAQIPVVLLTAKVQAADQELFSHLPIVTTVPKPFDPLTLVDQLATAFGWEP